MPQSTTSRQARRWLLRLLWAAGLMLVVGAVMCLLTGGLRVQIGGVVLSATKPARLLVEAFFVLIAAHLLSVPRSGSAESRVAHHATIGTILLVVGLLAALVLDSTPRRVGDGSEYMLMAFQLARGHSPAVSAADLAQFKDSLSPGDSFAEAAQLPPRDRMGRDGRYDCLHFWLYSLLAAPLVRLATVAGAHPNYGFAGLNLLMWAAAAFVLARRVSRPLFTLILTGPAVWWLDKAHSELLTVSALTVAVMLIDDAPWWATIALAVATTQNPAIAVALFVFAVYAAARGAARDRRFLLAVGVSGLVCALHPAYYEWHLGRLSPLQSAVTGDFPGITSLLTPLVDPNLGILVYFPAFTFLVATGVMRLAGLRNVTTAPAVLWPSAIVGGLFLFVFAQTANVNHGGTFNPSRYGLWLIPLGIPLLRIAEDRLGDWRSNVMTSIAVIACIWCCYMFAPRWSEHAGDQTTLARLVSTYAPTWYDPLPEVFAERVTGDEGRRVALPVAAPGCTKVLLTGDGTARPAWPIPCLPQDVPAECRPTGTLCYANARVGAYSFSRAPRQPGFSYDPPGGWVWKDARDPRLHRLLDVLGINDLVPLRAGAPGSFVAAATHLLGAHTWQGARGLVAWITSDPTTRLRIHVPRPGTAFWFDDASGKELERLSVTPASDAWLSVPRVPAPVLLILLGSRENDR